MIKLWNQMKLIKVKLTETMNNIYEEVDPQIRYKALDVLGLQQLEEIKRNIKIQGCSHVSYILKPLTKLNHVRSEEKRDITV